MELDKDQNISPPDGVSMETAIIFTKHMEALAQFYQLGLNLGDSQHAPGHIGFQVRPVYPGFDQVDVPLGRRAVTLWFTVNDLESSFNRLVELGAEDGPSARSRGLQFDVGWSPERES